MKSSVKAYNAGQATRATVIATKDNVVKGAGTVSAVVSGFLAGLLSEPKEAKTKATAKPAKRRTPKAITA